MAIAALEHLSYCYPQASARALDDVHLRVDGGVNVVTGPSGGGKSTLLRVFNGLVPHFHGGRISGDAEIAGHRVASTPTRKLAQAVGFVFQDPELQTVYAGVEREVAFGLENAAVPAADIPGRIREALDEAGALHLAGRSMRTLSGGERQRVALASALAMRPGIVVLDEPTSQLDDEGSALVLEAVRRIASAGRTVVVSEHRLHGLLDVAVQVVRVDGGEVSVIAKPHARNERLEAPASAAAGEELVVLCSVTAGYPTATVLEGVDLNIRRGEVIALIGPNGGGKTTLLRVIAGLHRPQSGAIERRARRIAYLPQNPAALLHRPTVRDEVRFTLDRAHSTDPPERILGELDLRHVAGRYPRDLSSGERQRAAVAAVLAGSPELVLLDEPTRGMDAAARASLVRIVNGLRDRGAAVVIATHDAELRAAVAQRTVTVRGGLVR